MTIRRVVRGLLLAVAIVVCVAKIWAPGFHATTPGYIVHPVTQECSPELRGEVGDIVVHVRASGAVTLNHDVPLQLSALGARLAEIYDVRKGRTLLDEPLSVSSISKRLRDTQYDIQRLKVVFLDVDNDLPFQTGTDVISIVKESVPNVRVVLLTPAAKPFCEQKWASVPPGA